MDKTFGGFFNWSDLETSVSFASQLYPHVLYCVSFVSVDGRRKGGGCFYESLFGLDGIGKGGILVFLGEIFSLLGGIFCLF